MEEEANETNNKNKQNRPSNDNEKNNKQQRDFIKRINYEKDSIRLKEFLVARNLFQSTLHNSINEGISNAEKALKANLNQRDSTSYVDPLGNSICINLVDLAKFDGQLAHKICENYPRYRKLLLEACTDEGTDHFPIPKQDGTVRNISLPLRLFADYNISVRPSLINMLTLRQVTSSRIGKLVAFRACVTSVSPIFPEVEVATFACESCGERQYVKVPYDVYSPPSTCKNPDCEQKSHLSTEFRSRKMIFLPQRSAMNNLRVATVQELTMEIPVGEVPRSLNVRFKDVETRNVVTLRSKALTYVNSKIEESEKNYSNNQIENNTEEEKSIADKIKDSKELINRESKKSETRRLSNHYHETCKEMRAGDIVMIWGTILPVPAEQDGNVGKPSIRIESCFFADGWKILNDTNLASSARGLDEARVSDLVALKAAISLTESNPPKEILSTRKINIQNNNTINLDKENMKKDDNNDNEEKEQEIDYLNIKFNDEDEEGSGLHEGMGFSLAPEKALKYSTTLKEYYGLANDQTELIRKITLPYLKERLLKSFAPKIYGREDEKLACLASCVGGVPVELPDMKIRGAVNTLLLGDPGVAKSQLLKFAVSIAEHSVYVSGRGASGAGLTAAAVKIPGSKEFSIEGGALVMGDKGIVCIDEFDKIQDTDRTAIYEVMEQETISLAKAGVTATLNARVTILAAANPKFGKWDTSHSIKENLDIPEALLSRFDVIFIIIDDIIKGESAQDTELGNYVTRTHVGKNIERNNENNFTTEYLDNDINLNLDNNNIINPQNLFNESELKAYISYAKTLKPIITEDLTEKVVTAYMEDRSHKDFVTPRALLSTLRLSQAMAKLRMSQVVTAADVDEARTLLQHAEETMKKTKVAQKGLPNNAKMARDHITGRRINTRKNI